MKFRDKCPQRSTGVSVEKDYKKYRSQLAADFNHRCGYCNDLDTPRKEYFEIDHFVPKDIMIIMTDNDYSNLVYACHSCNNAKRAKWPSKNEKISFVGNEGWIDPCDAHYEAQFERLTTGAIKPKTMLGKWMYDNLKLGKTQHEYLWNIEQLDKLCEGFQARMADNADNVVFKDQFLKCLFEYRKNIKLFFN